MSKNYHTKSRTAQFLQTWSPIVFPSSDRLLSTSYLPVCRKRLYDI